MPEFDTQSAKESINNFLWSILPPTATLAEAEDIAIGFLDKIDETWAKHSSRLSEKCASISK